MRTINVNTATRESAEQFKTDKFHRYCVAEGEERLDFIPAFFFTATADSMASQLVTPAFRLRRRFLELLDYSAGCWRKCGS